MLRYLCRLTVVLVTVLPWTCAGQVVTFYTPSGSTQVINAPNQPVSKNRYKITGAVVNSVTGEPIMRAAVRINGPAPSQQIFTDGSGHFEMNDVPEGQVAITAQRPRFLSAELTGRRPQIVTVGPATPPVQIKLIPESIIKGKVTSQEGEPLEGVTVQVKFLQINNGYKTWGMRGTAQTDENGEYDMEDLGPGQYILSTMTYTPAPYRALAENGADYAYPPQYYPNAAEQDSAQPINVQPGQAVEANLRLPLVRSYTVSGFFSGPEYTNIFCKDAGGNQIAWGQGDHRTSKFKLLHVPPGAYTLTLQGQEGLGVDTKNYFAEQTIAVGSSDIANLRVTMQPLSDVPVHFPDATPGAPLQMQLMPRQGKGNSQQFYLSSRPDSQVPLFQNVLPGSYKLVAQSLNNACVNTMFQGGTDLLRNDLIVTGGSARTEPIEVTLRNDCATLSGTVKVTSPGLAGMVLVVSDAAGMEPKVAPVFNGNFNIPGLVPGDYTVYAFDDISNLEYANPDALREFSGQKITLGPNAKTTVQLDLITRGEAQ